MSLQEMMSLGHVACRYNATSKKQLLQHLADMAAANCSVPARAILDAIMKREKLGNTGIGRGIAIPHALIEGLEEDIVLLATLDKSLCFDASDRRDVDIICMVLGPMGASSSHLTKVGLAARLLGMNADDIRQAISAEELLASVRLAQQNSAAA
jgi:PTS system nitrogen regulatory IIA component